MNLVLLTAWILYYILHSLLASSIAKTRLTFLEPYYRIFYNILALGGFSVLFFFQLNSHTPLLFRPVTVFVSVPLILLSVILILMCFRHYDKREFVGLSAGKQDLQKLNTEGLNHYVRHPLYFATLVFLAGYFLYKPTIDNLVFSVISTLYLFVGAWLEERKLVKQFGSHYTAYKKRVKMIIPFLI